MSVGAWPVTVNRTPGLPTPNLTCSTREAATKKASARAVRSAVVAWGEILNRSLFYALVGNRRVRMQQVARVATPTVDSSAVSQLGDVVKAALI
jgi:hypothetical protein